MKKHIFSCLTLAMVISSSALFAQTKAIAHRGVWKNSHLPQNSIASLTAAHDLKLFGSEFDVHLTKDNILVVNHDLWDRYCHSNVQGALRKEAS